MNGLTANVMSAPRNAFLNIHGKIIAVCDQLRVDADTFLICVEAMAVDRLIGHLEKYAQLNGSQLELSEQKVYVDLENSADIPEGALVIPQSAGRLVLTSTELPADVTQDEFLLFRVRNGIPQQGVDFDEDFLLNVSISEYVSFTKGCYLGQEPVSKVYNRSRSSWKLAVIKEENCDEAQRQRMTSKCVDPESGNVSGFVFLPNG